MDFNYIESDKFKNNSMLIAIPFEAKGNMTAYNILCQVLKRGTKKFDTQAKLNRHLQDMYGASIELAVSKRADKGLMIFYISYLKSKFTFDGEKLIKRSLELLNEIIYNPILKDGKFLHETVEMEKANHKRFLLSEYDDKKIYSINMAMEKIIGEPYSIPEYGLISEIDSINNDNLTKLWKETLEKPCLAYFTGDDNPNVYKEMILEKLPLLNKNGFKEEVVRYKNNDFKEDIIENMDINQAKITMLFNANSDIKEKDYYAVMLMSYIYGGGATSVLFNEIREKRSLAYYVSSGVDFFSSIMTVIMGVDTKNVSEAKKLALDYLEEMKQGKFDDSKIEIAKSAILKGKKQTDDSQFIKAMSKITSYIYDYDNSYEEAKTRLSEINKEDIMEASRKINYLGSYTVMKDGK